jgi:hypothetical protein
MSVNELKIKTIDYLNNQSSIELKFFVDWLHFRADEKISNSY